MKTPKRKKRKAKVKISQRAKFRKKSERPDSLKRVEGRPPADVGVTFKVKVRKK